MTRELRYVCLSDLHLGGRRSLLTDRPEGSEPAASEVLLALVECLRELVQNSAGNRPTLVLNGDVLELALASDEYSAIVFQRFMELVMTPGEELFADVWFLPGNHDHHLWEAAREAQYADYLLRHPDMPIPHPRFTTRMLREREKHPTTSPLLTTLLRRARAASGTQGELATYKGDIAAVSAIYPNLGVIEGDRCVIFHHGHYIEPAYQLLTTLNTKLFGAPRPKDVNQLEEGNFAWIDFFWSALGRAGEPGASVQYVYDRLRDPKLRAGLIDTLARNLAIAVRNRTSLGPVEDEAQRLTLHFFLTQFARYADTLGRQAYYGGATAVAAHDRGLEEYLAHFVSVQLASELGGRELPSEVTFVFGHTHHPFVRQGQTVPGFSAPLAVYNTGGWVHETGGLRPQVGASMVLVDAELEVAAIELYREVPTLDVRYPRVETVAAGRSGSALCAHLTTLLAEEPHPWQKLANAISQRLEAAETSA